MKLRLFETKKLHYGKYLYKLVIRNRLSHIFRTEFQRDGKLGYAKQKLDQCNTVYHEAIKNTNVISAIDIPWSSYNLLLDQIPIDEYFDAIELYHVLKNSSDYQLRIEVNQLYLYSNNRNFVVNLNNTLRNCVEFWEPNPETIETLNSDQNIIISDKPVDFKYKITFGRKHGSTALANWIRNNPMLAKIGATAMYYCEQESWVKGYYFYVKDDKALFMAQMIVGNNIQRIDKIVYRNE